ncbi:MAG: hypothetical protein LW817_01400 [Candidatus Caenarcaniphilales bacterium]|jgi:hypothetical protein|nr:hypothetical protein [Candidatus Caenarcaniphilales bacterium]
MNIGNLAQIGVKSPDLPYAGQIQLALPELELHNADKRLELHKPHENKTKERDLVSELIHRFENGPQWFQNFRTYFSLGITTLGAIFNGLAALANSTNIFGKNFSHLMDKQGELFAKYIIPFTLGWNGIEACFGKRPIEALSRFIPGISFLFLPFYNLNFATGFSSAMSYLFEHIKDRHGGTHPHPDSMLDNSKAVLQTSVDIFKDMFTLNTKTESFPKQIATLFLFLGSIGGGLFASQDRDSFAARLFGNMRNIGGGIADILLIFNDAKGDPSRRRDQTIVGSSCLAASIANILMRWVKNPKLARTLTHISLAMDNFGLSYWAQSSKKDNDKRIQAKQQNLLAMAA